MRARLDALPVLACVDCTDRGFIKAQQAVASVKRLAEVSAEGDVHALAAAVFAGPDGSAPGGNKKNWPAGGKEAMEARYEALAAALAAARDEYGAWVAALALSVAHDFAAEAAVRQSALGKLDFADLLGKTRDLLLRRRDVRAAFQAAFDYLLVDEFQDTDPLQAEIVFLLAEERAAADDWRAVRLKPGKLFVVGDPKQSIYRFRRADISLFDEVAALIAAQGEVLTISENFRTTPAIADWVNAVLRHGHRRRRVRGPSAALRADRAVPARVRRGLCACSWSTTSRRTGASPRRTPPAAARPKPSRRCSAEAVSEESAWQVRGSGDAQGGERLRPAVWGDCAVLLRTYTGLGVLERVFTEAGIPYRVEGGKAYFQRREVSDALLTLRAVDDAADPLAVYAALHSSLFGFADEDLFLFRRAGGSFDYLAPQPAGFPEVLAALDLLRELHESRTQRPWTRPSSSSCAAPGPASSTPPGERAPSRRSPTSTSSFIWRARSPPRGRPAWAASCAGRRLPPRAVTRGSRWSTRAATWCASPPSTRPRAWSSRSSSFPAAPAPP